MSDHLKQTIATFESQLAEQLAEVAKTRETINRIAEAAGLPKPYAQVEEPAGPSVNAGRTDRFYGKPLHTAMRLFLEELQHVGPATVAEIYDALIAGGYKFGAKDANNAKRIIRITLTKNSSVFHKLPNKSYGLLSWYPNVRAPKKDDPSDGASGEGDDDESAGEAGVTEDQELEDDVQSTVLD